METTLRDLCERLKTHGFAPELEGDADCAIRGVATLEEAGPGEASFLANPKYEKALQTTRASAVVLRPDVAAPERFARIRVKDPYAAVTALIVELHGYRHHPTPKRDADTPVIAPTAQIGENAAIHAGVTIEDDVVIGRNAVIYPGCYVGPGCRVGDDVLLYPNVVLYEGCRLGDRVTIHANTTVGEDGLGYAPVGEKWVKIPQIGRVEIGDDVEIGANCAIDRATLGRTRIGSGTKFSNLIAVGHGTHIDENCLFVAQVGLAGSVNVGKHVTLAGQVGVAGHISIGDNATVGAKAGVINNIPAGETYLGQPAIPIRDKKRQVALALRLPEINDTVKRLEKEVADLRRQLAAQQAGEVRS